MRHFRKVQTLSRKGRNLDSNPQITISSRYNLKKRSPMPSIVKDNKQEVIDTVLAQGDQIPIREENSSDSDLETLASNQSSEELSEEISDEGFEDMVDADVQELLWTLIARPLSHMKPEVLTGNKDEDIITWID